MSELQLKRVTREILDHAEQTLATDKKLPRIVDDYFVQRLKEDELHHVEVDPRLYERMRNLVKGEVLPLYDQFRQGTARLRERREKRTVWQYVIGTVCAFEVLEAILTHGRSLAPQILFPSVILEAFIGFIIYAAAQYIDDVRIARARKRLEKSIELLEGRVETDVNYDQRRELMDADVLRAEALEILTHYESAQDFWRDYRRVREADPTVPSELKSMDLPAFHRFLKYHVEGELSKVARQQRFNRLFIEAHEVFLSRDPESYALKMLKEAKS